MEFFFTESKRPGYIEGSLEADLIDALKELSVSQRVNANAAYQGQDTYLLLGAVDQNPIKARTAETVKEAVATALDCDVSSVQVSATDDIWVISARVTRETDESTYP